MSNSENDLIISLLLLACNFPSLLQPSQLLHFWLFPCFVSFQYVSLEQVCFSPGPRAKWSNSVLQIEKNFWNLSFSSGRTPPKMSCAEKHGTTCISNVLHISKNVLLIPTVCTDSLLLHSFPITYSKHFNHKIKKMVGKMVRKEKIDFKKILPREKSLSNNKEIYIQDFLIGKMNNQYFIYTIIHAFYISGSRWGIYVEVFIYQIYIQIYIYLSFSDMYPYPTIVIL